MGKKILTIGMATYDDFDGVYFSIQSLRMYHPITLTSRVEILVVDNNPKGKHSKPIKDLKNWIPNLTYVPFEDKTSTSARNEIFNNAKGKYCISMDCHVMFAPNSIEALLDYYDAHEDCKDLIQGPMLYDNLKGYSTHFNPIWGADMYGKWGKDEENHDKGLAFDIPMMGLGVFSCETKNWLGFNPLFKGFGGEEGYIHEKFRRNGGRALCLPQLRWLHRFARPEGVKYPLILEDRIWNYFVGWLEITQDPEDQMIKDIYENFKHRIPQDSLDSILHHAIKATLNKESQYV